eukprot:scaffold14035_cov55-Attheya_sp.AAC.5
MMGPRSLLSHGVTCIESAYAPLMGVTVKAVDSGASVDLGSFLKEGSSSSNKSKNILVLGTYAADFNAIEYAQRLQHYVPILREKHGVDKVGFVLNCETDAAEKLADMVKGRWPNTALELDDNDNVEVNKFAELPYVGEWKRRPLELATLRLQNMLDISIKNWKELAPSEEALKAGVLTQLGGCIVYDPSEESVVFEWRDPGICAVANFESILKKLPTTTTSAKEDEPSLIATP